MNILVTGGKGYLGRYIVQELLNEGHSVVNYNRDVCLPSDNPKHSYVVGELYDVARLVTTIQIFKVDRIIHTAGQSHPDVGIEVPLATAEANVMGTMGVLEAARLTGIKRVVVYSSECAYGNTHKDLVTEDHPLNPRTPYGVTKAATEMMARAYNECYGLVCIALRVCQVWGPGQVMQEYIRDAIRAAVRGEAFSLERGRDQKFQLIYITDAAKASVAACFTENESALSVYNITGGYQPTFGEVLTLLQEIIPDAQFDVGPGDFEYDDQGIFDISAAKADLGYIPLISLKEGLEAYVSWLRNHDL
ncbi:NAD-dependent epimerase/dehydratase family protein [Neobacillus massiliamazoniensis]|uniref:NAD-dependent epimerase/dehydratase n=1 Tax=Neobacillus massiliamazoniensis TaxID=1499688 RepID=A0A0U1NYE7_9BACI|nr:NAD(P)-dependent oxidoreductase [Neobacillus massiliamazoniensis]CRK83054.1 NAD-dependent epimerase/dehydratase [Neobacillus massiliamazoniensis]